MKTDSIPLAVRVIDDAIPAGGQDWNENDWRVAYLSLSPQKIKAALEAAGVYKEGDAVMVKTGTYSKVSLFSLLNPPPDEDKCVFEYPPLGSPEQRFDSRRGRYEKPLFSTYEINIDGTLLPVMSLPKQFLLSCRRDQFCLRIEVDIACTAKENAPAADSSSTAPISRALLDIYAQL